MMPAPRAKGKALLPITRYLTSSGYTEFDRTQQRTYRGQAHFAIGPEFCSTCAHWGYRQTLRSAAGDVTGTRERKSSCHKFYELVGQHGPGIPANAWSCKHYQKREA
jgi:hypothetical protein